MQFGRSKWEMKRSETLNLLRIRGILLDGENYLLEVALKIIDIAQNNSGKIIPLTKFPSVNEKNESVYFEIIFKTEQDLENFIDEVGNSFN